MTATEKKIIEAFLLIRDNKNDEATQILKYLSQSPFPFVEAMKKQMMGLAFNNQSMYREAEKEFLSAIPEFEKLQCHYFQFMAYFNLFIIYLNEGSLNKAGAALSEMEKIPRESELQSFRLERCQLDYFIETDNFTKAHEVLNKIKIKKIKIPESDTIPQLISEFILFVKEEKFLKCQAVLSEMKKHRKFHLTENFNFMKKLLDHIVDNSPIYINADTFSSVPVLDHQMRVIRSLEEQDLNEAIRHWKALAAISPDLYKDSFEYNGPKCLFSICLKKHLSNQQSLSEIPESEDQSQVDSLLHLLSKASAPLHKSYLYEFLWREPPQKKEDLKKLSRLMTKIRSEKGIEISYKKGTYFINKGTKKTRVG